MTMHGHISEGGQTRLRRFVEAGPFQQAVVLLVVVNAITLGLETSSSVMAAWGPWLHAIDRFILALFVLEIGLRIAAHGRRFFTNGWNLFDFAVITIALAPQGGAFSVLRALRILRVFRLVSAVPEIRSIVEALLKSVPGLSAIILLLGLVFYVFAVMATKLFGDTNPELFGTLGASLYALFQVMTLEGWSGDVVNPVMEHHPYALAFFIPFMLLSTFTVLNLFIALIVDSMQKLHKAEIEIVAEGEKNEAAAVQARMLGEISALSAEIRALRAIVENLRRAS